MGCRQDFVASSFEEVEMAQLPLDKLATPKRGLHQVSWQSGRDGILELSRQVRPSPLDKRGLVR